MVGGFLSEAIGEPESLQAISVVVMQSFAMVLSSLSVTDLSGVVMGMSSKCDLSLSSGHLPP
jgi:hypothetical protein